MVSCTAFFPTVSAKVLHCTYVHVDWSNAWSGRQSSSWKCVRFALFSPFASSFLSFTPLKKKKSKTTNKKRARKKQHNTLSHTHADWYGYLRFSTMVSLPFSLFLLSAVCTHKKRLFFLFSIAFNVIFHYFSCVLSDFFYLDPCVCVYNHLCWTKQKKTEQ